MEGAGHQIIIALADLSLVDSVRQQVAKLLPTTANLLVHDWTALQPGLKQAIQADMSSAFFLYVVLVVLVAFSVLNTQLMSVLERTREFGIILALGLTPARLGRLVLLETAMMGLIGLGLGVLLGLLVTLWFSINGLSIPGMEEMAANFNLPARMYPQPSWITLFLGPSVVFVFTLIAALYPAWRLHALAPVAAMRAA